jgi:dihydrofolate reductase
VKREPGKDIWLFGGGELASALLATGLVDTVEVAVCPVLLGSGVSLCGRVLMQRLRLQQQRVYPKTGIVRLDYAVVS